MAQHRYIYHIAVVFVVVYNGCLTKAGSQDTVETFEPVHNKQNLEGKMYMASSASKDLASSATGYIYTSYGNGPAKYVQLGDNSGSTSAYYGKHFGGLGSEGGIGIGHGGYGHFGGAGLSGLGHLAKYQQAEELEDDAGDAIEAADIEDAGESAEYNLAGGEFKEEVEGDAGVDGYHGGNYKRGGGEEQDASHYASQGEKGEKGYKSQHAFDKGEAGKHGAAEDAGFYNEQAGHKKAHHDEAGQYGEHNEGAKGYKSASFGAHADHKKGSKTTGFHNVYHKDEYKKDHSFYDEANNSAHQDKHGEFEAKHAAAQGGFRKGGRQDAAYDVGEKGKKGSYDKGEHFDEEKGFEGREGHDGYHGHKEEFSKKGDQSNGKEYGYSSSRGEGGSKDGRYSGHF
ncbi:uncharacterized protein [Anabrus simplex]|uniref:uncharacterized protein n=1 Tax=Anabrus simplex TaxID=316456 RepID=UPI0035A36A29